MTAAVYETKNYGMFELHEFNRNVVNTRSIELSLRRNGWIDAYPMHVVRNGKGKLKIKDGHYRFEAARHLGIPVKYVICNDGAPLVEMIKATKPWHPADYLYSYVRQGKHEYIALKDYMELTGISLRHAISMLSGESAGSCNQFEAFKRGEYRLGDTARADQVAKMVLHMKKCGIKYADNSYLVQALSKAVWLDEFSVTRFMDKISAHWHHFDKQPDVKSYLTQIEEIYNRHAQSDKLPLAFLANERSLERKRTFGNFPRRK